jgi:2-dehydro-3-deoxy-D-arabinonate dehydratase
MFKLCRFRLPGASPRIGLAGPKNIVRDLTSAGIRSLTTLLAARNAVARTTVLSREKLPSHRLSEVELLAPIERQEIWAAGVTYSRSKTARMEESTHSATAYDRVYEAERPELFFKAMPHRVAGPGEAVGLRRDSKWTVPEPELALIASPDGRLAGVTMGNDMSARDIEGENLLYLPQAKIYDGSCALGPWVAIGASEAEIRAWTIGVKIRRGSKTVFEGDTSVGRIKRSFDELLGFLFRSQTFSAGAVLLTGTGVVPPNDFTLQPGDRVTIRISSLGELTNPVVEV